MKTIRYVLFISALLWGLSCRSKLEDEPKEPEIPVVVMPPEEPEEPVTPPEEPPLDPPIKSEMTLYDKPLSTIQKVIEGKWKWYVAYGGVEGISYPDSTFIEFKENHYILELGDGTQRTIYFTWEKLPIKANGHPLKGYKTYVMKIEENVGRYFESIRNDTLLNGSYANPIVSNIFIRVK